MKNNQAVKNGAAFKSLGEKGCESKVGSQEMAASMSILINLISTLLKFISINIIAAVAEAACPLTEY